MLFPVSALLAAGFGATFFVKCASAGRHTRVARRPHYFLNARVPGTSVKSAITGRHTREASRTHYLLNEWVPGAYYMAHCAPVFVKRVGLGWYIRCAVM